MLTQSWENSISIRCKTPLRVADEEDVIAVAFAAFLRGMRQGSFFKIDNRRDLWQALVVLVECAARDIRRKHLALKRGGGHVRGESVFNLTGHDESVGGLAQIPVGPPGPQYAEIMLELAEQRFWRINGPTAKANRALED